VIGDLVGMGVLLGLAAVAARLLLRPFERRRPRVRRQA
jgi:hypothetical protein